MSKNVSKTITFTKGAEVAQDAAKKLPDDGFDALFDLTDVTDKMWDNMISLFVYQGYNPLKFILVLWGYMLSSAVTNKIEQFQEDMLTCICFLSERGSKPGRALEKSSPEAQKRFQTILDRYRVKDTDPKNPPKDPYEVTLPRIAGCFPKYVATLIALAKVSPPANVGSDKLPIYLCFPGAPAIMDTATYDKHFDDWIEWSRAFSKVIQAKFEEPRARTIGNAIFNSDLVKQGKRTNILSELAKQLNNNNSNK